jgi:hypothetical protein
MIKFFTFLHILHEFLPENLKIKTLILHVNLVFFS